MPRHLNRALWINLKIGYDPSEVRNLDDDAPRPDGMIVDRRSASSKRGYTWRWITWIICVGFGIASCQAIPSQNAGVPMTKATTTPESIPTSSVAADTPSPEPTRTGVAECASTEGELVEGSYAGVVYDGQLPYTAYLPPCYASESGSYPVVFIINGYPYDQRHWIDLDLFDAYERGRVQHGWPDVVFILPSVPDSLFTHSDGGVGSYEQEFLEGLIPAVSAAFDNSVAYALGGVSRGGVWALEIGLRNANQFEHILAVSPALVYNQPRPPFDPFEIIREDRSFPMRIFISAAENESPFREQIEAFIVEMKQQDIEHTFLLHPGNHSDQTWRSIMDEILTSLFADFGS